MRILCFFVEVLEGLDGGIKEDGVRVWGILFFEGVGKKYLDEFG